LVGAGNADEAENTYREAIGIIAGRSNPEIREAEKGSPQNRLGALIWKKGLRDQAITYFSQAAKDANPFEPEGARVRANLKQAIAELRAEIELHPKDSRLYYLLGRAVAVSIGLVGERDIIDPAGGKASPGEDLKAKYMIPAFRKAVELDAENAEAHCALGSALERQGTNAEVAKEYRAAIRLKPDYWAYVGLSQCVEGDISIAALRAAREVSPHDMFAAYELARRLTELGKTKEAIAASRDYLKVEPYDWVVHDQLGRNLEAAGDLEGAVAEFRLYLDCSRASQKGWRNVNDPRWEDIKRLERTIAERAGAAATTKGTDRN
jgi:tetratricopeptide (TPR) repeat protein